MLFFNCFLSSQVSIVKDDDSPQVNGQLVPDSQCGELATDVNASTVSYYDSKSGTTGWEAANKNSLKDEASSMQSTEIAPRIHGNHDNNDKLYGNDNDDIYNFDISDDQRQATQELYNLKLDIGFTEG